MLRSLRPLAAKTGDETTLSAMDRAVAPPRLTLPRAGIAALSLLVLGMLAAAYFRYGRAGTPNVQRDRVVISDVRSGSFADYIPLTGSVVPLNSVHLAALESGQVIEVLSEEGALVSAGQPLLRLKNTNLQTDVLGREAQLIEQLGRLAAMRLSAELSRANRERSGIDAQFEIDRLVDQVTRRRELFASALLSKVDLGETEAQLARARRLKQVLDDTQTSEAALQQEQIQQVAAAVDALRGNLAIARQNLDGLTIRAPVAGRLSAMEATVGQSKAPGERIGQIDQVDGFRIAALVDEFYLARVSEGQAARTEIDGASHTLRIAKVYPQVSDRQFKIDLLFDGAAPGGIRGGQTVQLRLDLGDARAGLLVANGAFFDDSGGAWAFVVSPSGRDAVRRTVRFGRRAPDAIEVLEGLSAGDRIITSTYGSLKDAHRLRIQDGWW